tara:strand:+ start:1463 stop:1897 length:435 start_codon:yes stop_codon:yes gene_type:complete
MLILNTELWNSDNVAKIQCSENWSEKDSSLITTCVLEQIKNLLNEVITPEEQGVLLFDCTKGSFPPMTEAMRIVKFMVSIKPEIEKGLNFSIVYVKSKINRDWINGILRIYRPVRPVHVVSSKEEVKKLLIDSKNEKITSVASC